MPRHPLTTRIALAAWLGAAASACSAYGPLVGGGTGPALGAPVRLAAGSVQADVKVVGDADKILEEAAGDSFAAEGLSCQPGAAPCGKVDLRASMHPAGRAFAAADPALRVVELVARYHGAGAMPSASTTSYQRSVAVRGNLSTATWMRLSDALTTDLAQDFSTRGNKRAAIVLRLPSWAAGGDAPAAAGQAAAASR